MLSDAETVRAHCRAEEKRNASIGAVLIRSYLEE